LGAILTLAARQPERPASQGVLLYEAEFERDLSSHVERLIVHPVRAERPWPKRPCVYYDPRALSTDLAICASLHAKCIVIDDEIAFVTSANFTEWAQERNLEAGVLIRDGGFARSLRNQFESLIAASRLRLLPGSAE
jgi:phosphatidylserine/phosphatidylglycerophosphate/cardiolipin synthase-like enzyme